MLPPTTPGPRGESIGTRLCRLEGGLDHVSRPPGPTYPARVPLSPHGALLSTTVLAVVLSGVVPSASSATPEDPPPDATTPPAADTPFVWADDPPPPAVRRTVAPRASADALRSATASSAAAGDVLALHSLPGSQHTIFLDFDGQVVSGTA